MGLRYRLHEAKLPGKPDLVFTGRRVCVFVHGCFWHGCPNCVDGTRAVKSNTAYWSAKITGNRERDARNMAALEQAGWQVVTIWECETQEAAKLSEIAEMIRIAGLPQSQKEALQARGDNLFGGDNRDSALTEYFATAREVTAENAWADMSISACCG